ncbi:MAG: hypothetical protein MJ062_07710, partial [Oscillospiraceae bacterium]|nr:hypothetical protein [Oscillospiraceae bacterium]
CGVQRRRLWSLSADSETPPPSKTQERVNLIAEQSKRGNPNEGFPLNAERHKRFLGTPSFLYVNTSKREPFSIIKRAERMDDMHKKSFSKYMNLTKMTRFR